MEPQTDREILMQLSGEIKSLNQNIERLGDAFKNMEEKRIAKIEEELEEFRLWKNQLQGGWKLAVALWGVGGASFVYAIKQLFFK